MKEFFGLKLNSSTVKKIIAKMNVHRCHGSKIVYFEIAEVDSPLLDAKEWAIFPGENVNQKYDIRCGYPGGITSSCDTNKAPKDLKGDEVLDFYLFERFEGERGDLCDNLCFRLKNGLIVDIAETNAPKTWFNYK